MTRPRELGWKGTLAFVTLQKQSELGDILNYTFWFFLLKKNPVPSRGVRSVAFFGVRGELALLSLIHPNWLSARVRKEY